MPDNIEFDTLDNILLQRQIPEIPEGLAQRIIIQAQQKQAKARVRKPAAQNIWQTFLDHVQTILFLPKPVYLVIVFLGLGLWIGVLGSNAESLADTVLPSMTPYELASFMTIEDRFVAGEWL